MFRAGWGGPIWYDMAFYTASLPVWLSAAAMLLLLGSGWLGGELAYVHGIGVTEPELPSPRVEVRPQPFSREAARR